VTCEYLGSGWGYCHLGNLSTIPNNTIVFSNTTAYDHHKKTTIRGIGVSVPALVNTTWTLADPDPLMAEPYRPWLLIKLFSRAIPIGVPMLLASQLQSAILLLFFIHRAGGVYLHHLETTSPYIYSTNIYIYSEAGGFPRPHSSLHGLPRFLTKVFQ
jgi:hypothetical protein